MTDLDSAILRALNKILPILKSDPQELHRRLARRCLSILHRPPRSWSLAIRASDRRITEATALIVPEDALDPNEPDYPLAHTVTLTHSLISLLCAPITLDGWGEDLTRIARRLGCHPNTLDRARRQGRFVTRLVPHLGGKRGKPIPVLHCHQTLDPSSANLRQRPDAIFGAMWEHLIDQLPKNFEQEIDRLPCFVHRPNCKTRLSRHRGFRWRCPACRRPVRTLFHPMPPLDPQKFPTLRLPISDAYELPTPAPMFACHKCHRLRYFSRVDRSSWNNLIAYLTGGLLYGQEVQRPTWFTKSRQRPVRPHLNRPPSKRREQILNELLKGKSYKQIAAELGIAFSTVHSHIKKIYTQHRVHGLPELAKQLKVKLPAQRLSPKTHPRPLLAGALATRVPAVSLQ